MKSHYYVLGIIVSLIHISLKPILDGRVTPIYLDTRYTFTNFEWARGRVYFKEGFDLPVNGTAILDIVDEPITGDVLFQNSTLIMNDHLRIGIDANLTGSGFINANRNTLYLDGDHSNVDKLFIFTNHATIAGTGSNFFDVAAGGIAFTFVNVVFKDLVLIGPLSNTFYTEPGKPNTLQLTNISIRLLGGSFTLNPNLVRIWRGPLSIRGSNGAEFITECPILIQQFGTITVKTGITFSVNEMRSVDPAEGLTLENAKLNYTSTSTSDFLFNAESPGQNPRGVLTVIGQCELSADIPKEIILGHQGSIYLESGSRLTVNPGIHLKIH